MRIPVGYGLQERLYLSRLKIGQRAFIKGRRESVQGRLDGSIPAANAFAKHPRFCPFKKLIRYTGRLFLPLGLYPRS